MSDVAIHIEHLSKAYCIMHAQSKQTVARYKTLQEDLLDLPSRLWSAVRNGGQSAGSNRETVWALKDVSIDIHEGEVVGIVGRNGAGKSTLLKILSRITDPTEGRAEVYGRVGSLLEVGTGFHPELTGRENVFLNGTVLGMSRYEIARKFDEIIAFAEVEKFIDTPVKFFSSGMYVRLAFAVAAHLEPEILVVDEVLAVGDTEFQKKCVGKIGDVARGGRTVLFVSHNMGMITTLCEKAILLMEGKIDFVGPAQSTVSKYLSYLGTDAGLKKEWSFEEAPGGQYIKVRWVEVADHQGIQKPYFSVTEPIFLTVDYWILSNGGAPVNVSLFLFDEKGNWICSVGNYKETKSKPIIGSGLYRSKCTIPGNLLNSGKHTITVVMVTNLSDMTLTIPQCVAFETVDDDRVHSKYSKWAGIIKPDFYWQSDRLGDVETKKHG
jgi:lipopolysaccharide transport system ATP-binding protein